MVRALWNIRDPDKNDSIVDYARAYAKDPNFFSLKIHHGGMFSESPGRKYVNGRFSFVDNVDVDLFSVIELSEMILMLGYEVDRIMYYQYLIPALYLDHGIRALGSDQDVHELCRYVLLGHRLLNVYIEHDETTVDIYTPSPFKKCTITELEDDEVIVNKSCAKRLTLEWSGSEIGQSSGAKEMGQTEFTQDFYDALDNPDFDPFLGLDDDEVVAKATEVEQTLNTNDNDDEILEENSESGEDSKIGEDTDDDSDDSDYIVDEINDIDEVEVDMENFHANVDVNVEFMGSKKKKHVTFEEPLHVEVIDNDEFDSGDSGDDDVEKARKRKLKDLKKKMGKNAEGGSNKTYFYVGQSIGTAKEAKEMIKLHSIETRREIQLKKNDKVRIRAECCGTIPTLGSDNAVGPNENEGNANVCDQVGPDGKAGPSIGVKWTKSKIRLESPLKVKMTKSKIRAAVSPLKSKDNKVAKPNKKPTAENKCPWSLQISKCKDESWSARTYQPVHRCLQTRKVKACTYNFLAKDILRQIESNPCITIKAVQAQTQQKFKLEVSRMKAFRAKSEAVKQIQGDHTQQYANLRDYVLELKDKNPNTTVKIQCERPSNPGESTRVFQRIYICLGATKEGFKAGMRDLLGLDGAFMKGPFPGQLLTAVGLDSNNGIYPLAYGIVETENLESWTWFLEQLGDDLDLVANSNFTFISDRQKGIIPAIAKLFPAAEHRFCLKHIHENMKLKWSGKAFKDLLWKCATATTMQHFTHAMDELKTFKKEAHDWLCKIPKDHWSRSHFSGRAKSDVLLNNMCEVFNGKLVEGRDRPIISALEYVREYLMRRIKTVNGIIDKSEGPLTPTATKILKSISDHAADYVASWNGGDKYQVCGPWFDQCVVSVSQKSCSCRYWELTGIPCKHVVDVNWDMAQNNMNPGLIEEWVHPCYRLETWKKMYSHTIGPINGPTMWPKCQIQTTILPPSYHPQPGRPNKARKKSASEKIDMVKDGKLSRAMKTVTCDLCKMTGHNKRTCKSQGGQKGKQTATQKRKENAPSESQPTSKKGKQTATQNPSQSASQQKKKPAKKAADKVRGTATGNPSPKGKRKAVKRKTV